MIIIALEGLDKAGKNIQSKLLKQHLENVGYTVELSEFHRYDSPTGELIAKWLRKEYDVDQLTIEFIMAADKQSQQRWFEELDENGTEILILDRYTASQAAYAIANDVPRTFVKSLQRYMRQPDLTIFIDIPPEVSMVRKGKHNNGENDRYESDLELLKRVRATYLTEALPSDWQSVVVNGERSIEAVHEDIMRSGEINWLLSTIQNPRRSE